MVPTQAIFPIDFTCKMTSRFSPDLYSGGISKLRLRTEVHVIFVSPRDFAPPSGKRPTGTHDTVTGSRKFQSVALRLITCVRVLLFSYRLICSVSGRPFLSRLVDRVVRED